MSVFCEFIEFYLFPCTKSDGINFFDCCMRKNKISICTYITFWWMKGFNWKIYMFSRCANLTFFLKCLLTMKQLHQLSLYLNCVKPPFYHFNVGIFPGKKLTFVLNHSVSIYFFKYRVFLLIVIFCLAIQVSFEN